MPTILDGGRLTRVREGMTERGVDALVLGPGPDLLYVAGYAAHTSERLTALVAGLVGTPQLVLPQLEVEGARLHASALDLVAWSEHEDPATLVADRLRELRSDSDGPLTIAVGDHLWSVFLLRLQSAMPQVEWLPASEVVAPARLVKSGEEIALLRRAASAADRVWEQVSREPLEGLTERVVAARVADHLLAEGAEDVAFNIVASGPHSAAPHHSPGDRVLQNGDMLVLDYGGTLQGYHSDITRTLSIGPASEEQRRVYAAVQEAQERAVQAVRPGVAVGEVDRAARSYLEEAGLAQYFVHRTGHGLGLETHEPPYIIEGGEDVLQEGMVFSVEPGVYIPGEFGVRIEDIVVVGPTGGERLNNAGRILLEV